MKRRVFQQALTQLEQTLRQDEATDAELLTQFVTDGNAPAFATLLQRHGPMVYGVCRRVLQNEADADDAFQATFLVLVRKAGRIQQRHLFGNWLYGVAHTTALKARAMKQQRRDKERQAPRQDEVVPDTSPEWLDLLDEELSRLPDIYRSVLVLCDFEGKSNREAARLLGCPLGTVGARIARGRRLLAARLTRRGVTLSVGGLLAGLPTTQAFVPAWLWQTTLEAVHGAALTAPVAALTDKVMKSMMLKKMKVAFLVMMSVSAATLGLGMFPGDGTTAQAQTKEVVAKIEHDLTNQRLEGVWIPEQLVTTTGVARYPLAGRALFFHQGQFVRMEGNHLIASGKFKIDEGYLRLTTDERNPWDLEAGESKAKQQYSFKVEGDLLTLCFDATGKAKASDLTPGVQRQVTVYKRQTPTTVVKPSVPAPHASSSDGNPLAPTTLPSKPARPPLLGTPANPFLGGDSNGLAETEAQRLERLERELQELRKLLEAQRPKSPGM